MSELPVHVHTEGLNKQILPNTGKPKYCYRVRKERGRSNEATTMSESENASFRNLQTQLRKLGAGGTHASVMQSLANMCREEEKIRDRETYKGKRESKKEQDESKFMSPESFWRRRFVGRLKGGHGAGPGQVDTEKEDEDPDASVFTRYVQRKYRGISSDQSDEEEKKPVTFSRNIQEMLLKMTFQFGSAINDAYVSDPSQVMALGKNDGTQAMMKMSQIDENMKAIDQDMQILQQAKEQGEITATDQFTGFENLGEEDCLYQYNEGFSSEDSEEDSEDTSDDSEGDSESDSNSSSDDSSESNESSNDDSEQWDSDGDDSSMDSNFIWEMANKLGFHIPAKQEDASVDLSSVKLVAVERREFPKSALKYEARVIKATLAHSDTIEQANAGSRSARDNAAGDSSDDGSDSDSDWSDDRSDDRSDSDESGSEDSGVDLYYGSDSSPLLDGDDLVPIAAAVASQVRSPNTAMPTLTLPAVSPVLLELDANALTASEDSPPLSCLSSSPLVLIKAPAPGAKFSAPQVSAPPTAPRLFATQVIVAGSSAPSIPLLSAADESEYQADFEDDLDDNESENSDLYDDCLAQFEAIRSAAKPLTTKPKSARLATPPQHPHSALQERSTLNRIAVPTVSSPGNSSAKALNSLRLQPSAVFGTPSGIGANVGCFDATGKPNVRAATRHSISSYLHQRASLHINDVLSDLCIAARLAAAADEDMAPFAELESSKKVGVQVTRHDNFDESDEDSEGSDKSLKPDRFFVSFSSFGDASGEIKPEKRYFIDQDDIKSGLCEGINLFGSFSDVEDVEREYYNEGDINFYVLPRKGTRSLTRVHVEEVNSTEDETKVPAGSLLVDFNSSSNFYSGETFNLSGSALLVEWADDDSGLLVGWDDGNDDSGAVEPCEPLVSDWHPRRSAPEHPTNASATSEGESPLYVCSTETPLFEGTVTHHDSNRFGIVTKKSAATAHTQLCRRRSRCVSFLDAFRNLDLHLDDAGLGSNDSRESIGNEVAAALAESFPKIDFQTKKCRIQSKKKRDDDSLSTRRRRKIRESKQKSKLMEEKHYIEGLCILNKRKGRTVGCTIKSQI